MMYIQLIAIGIASLVGLFTGGFYQSLAPSWPIIPTLSANESKPLPLPFPFPFQTSKWFESIDIHPVVGDSLVSTSFLVNGCQPRPLEQGIFAPICPVLQETPTISIHEHVGVARETEDQPFATAEPEGIPVQECRNEDPFSDYKIRERQILERLNGRTLLLAAGMLLLGLYKAYQYGRSSRNVEVDKLVTKTNQWLQEHQDANEVRTTEDQNAQQLLTLKSTEVAQLQAQYESQIDANQRLRAKLAKSESQIVNLQNERDSHVKLKAELDHQLSEVLRLQALNDAALLVDSVPLSSQHQAHEIELLEVKLAASQSEVDRLKVQRDEQENVNRSLQAQVERQITSAAGEDVAAQQETREALKSKQDEIDVLRTQLDTLASERIEITDFLTETTERLADSEAKLKDTSKVLDKAKAEHKVLQQKHDQLAEWKVKNQDVVKASRGKDLLIERLQNDVKTMRSSTKIEQDSRQEQSDKQISELEETLATRGKDLDEANKRIADLKAKADRSRAKFDEQESALNKRAAEASASDHKAKQLSEQLESAKQELATERNSVNGQLSRLQTAYETLSNERDGLTKEVGKLQKDLHDQQRINNAKAKENKGIEKEKSKLKEEIKNLKSASFEFADAHEQLRSEIQEKDAQIKDLAEKNLVAHAEVQDRCDEIKSLHQNHSKLSSLLQGQYEQLRKLADNNRTLTTRLEGKESEIEALQTQAKDLSTQLEVLRKTTPAPKGPNYGRNARNLNISRREANYGGSTGPASDEHSPVAVPLALETPTTIMPLDFESDDSKAIVGGQPLKPTVNLPGTPTAPASAVDEHPVEIKGNLPQTPALSPLPAVGDGEPVKPTVNLPRTPSPAQSATSSLFSTPTALDKIDLGAVVQSPVKMEPEQPVRQQAPASEVKTVKSTLADSRWSKVPAIPAPNLTLNSTSTSTPSSTGPAVPSGPTPSASGNSKPEAVASNTADSETNLPSPIKLTAPVTPKTPVKLPASQSAGGLDNTTSSMDIAAADTKPASAVSTTMTPSASASKLPQPMHQKPAVESNKQNKQTLYASIFAPTLTVPASPSTLDSESQSPAPSTTTPAPAAAPPNTTSSGSATTTTASKLPQLTPPKSNSDTPIAASPSTTTRTTTATSSKDGLQQSRWSSIPTTSTPTSRLPMATAIASPTLYPTSRSLSLSHTPVTGPMTPTTPSTPTAPTAPVTVTIPAAAQPPSSIPVRNHASTRGQRRRGNGNGNSNGNGNGRRVASIDLSATGRRYGSSPGSGPGLASPVQSQSQSQPSQQSQPVIIGGAPLGDRPNAASDQNQRPPNPGADYHTWKGQKK